MQENVGDTTKPGHVPTDLGDGDSRDRAEAADGALASTFFRALAAIQRDWVPIIRARKDLRWPTEPAVDDVFARNETDISADEFHRVARTVLEVHRSRLTKSTKGWRAARRIYFIGVTSAPTLLSVLAALEWAPAGLIWALWIVVCLLGTYGWFIVAAWRLPRLDSFLPVVGVGLGTFTYVVLAPYPGPVVATLLVGVGLSAFAAALLVATLLYLSRTAQLDRYASLLYGLGLALGHLLEWHARTAGVAASDYGPPDTYYEGATLNRQWQQEVSHALEVAARQTDASLYRWVHTMPDLGAMAEASKQGRRIGAWVRQRQAALLLPAPTGAPEVERAIASGLVAACLGRWDEIQADTMEPTPKSLVRRALPRVAPALALGLLAWLVPRIPGIEKATASSLRVSFIAAAVGALLTPQKAVLDALTDVKKTLGRQNGAGSA